MQYVIIHGFGVHGDRLHAYIENIVYETPERIFAVSVGNRRFVALVEYGDAQETWARGTFKRMPSFNLGSMYTVSVDVAWREFGSWIGHYAGFSEPGKGQDELIEQVAALVEQLADEAEAGSEAAGL